MMFSFSMKMVWKVYMLSVNNCAPLRIQYNAIRAYTRGPSFACTLRKSEFDTDEASLPSIRG